MDVCALSDAKDENMVDFVETNTMQRFGAP